jgi:hypothetical protein
MFEVVDINCRYFEPSVNGAEDVSDSVLLEVRHCTYDYLLTVDTST